MKLSRATTDEIKEIRALEAEAFGFTWDEAIFLKELSRPNGLTVVGKMDGRVVGSALLAWADEEIQLNSLVLAPEYRGRGLSRDLLGGMMAWSQQRGFTWMTLEVKWDNPPAYRLYKHFGFVTTGRRPRYYRDGQDARIMWAGHLSSPGFLRSLERYRDERLLM